MRRKRETLWKVQEGVKEEVERGAEHWVRCQGNLPSYMLPRKLQICQPTDSLRGTLIFTCRRKGLRLICEALSLTSEIFINIMVRSSCVSSVLIK